jgi:hypothetical protein
MAFSPVNAGHIGPQEGRRAETDQRDDGRLGEILKSHGRPQNLSGRAIT